MLRRILIGFMCLLLVISLFGANMALAADRGPLDGEHTKESAAGADIYAAIQEEAAELIGEEIPAEFVADYDLAIDDIIAAVITEAWIQDEAERNIDSIYAFIDNDEKLDLYIDTGSLAGEMESALASEFAALEYSAFGIDHLDRMLEGESAYENERQKLRNELLAELGIDPDDGFGNPTLGALIASEASYENERSATHAAIAEDIVDELDARHGFGDEDVGALLESESSYETQQEAFRDQQKDRIQEETSEELSDEELAEAYADQQDEIEANTQAELEAMFEAETQDAPIAIDEQLSDLAEITASALAADLSYNTYHTEYHAVVDDIESDIETYVAENGEEFAPEIEEIVSAEFETVAEEKDIPAPVVDEFDPLIDLTVEALTTDLSYNEFSTEYEAITADITDAGVTYVWENREAYEEKIDAAVGEQLAERDVPEPIEDEIDGFVDLVIEAVLTDTSYETFTADVSDNEAAMSSALVDVLFGGDDGIPERIDLTEELDGIEEELAPLQDASNIIGALSIVLPLLSMGLLGGIYYLTTNVALTSLIGGGASLIIGGLSYIGSATAGSIIAEEIEAANPPDHLVQPLTDFLLAQLAPLSGQSLVLLGIGGGLTLAGIGMTFGIHEQFLSGGETEEPETGVVETDEEP